MRRMYSLEQLKNVVDERLASGQVPSAKIFENIVDENGHSRFIEGDINIKEITGITKTFGKWSLSGSHLLMVLMVNIDNDATLDGALSTDIELPAWVKSKITPLVAQAVIIKEELAYNTIDATTQSARCVLRKPTTNTIRIDLSSFTASKSRVLRIGFDLLIDNE